MLKNLRDFINQLNNKDKRALTLLGVITLVTHYQWIFNYRIFTSGDWWYLSPERYRDYFHFSPIWVTDGFGGTSATPSFYLIRFFEGALSFLGSNFAINEKLFFFF